MLTSQDYYAIFFYHCTSLAYPFSIQYVEGTRCSHDLTSLIPRPSTPPVLIACSMQKQREKIWGILSH